MHFKNMWIAVCFIFQTHLLTKLSFYQKSAKVKKKQGFVFTTEPNLIALKFYYFFIFILLSAA
jgi:hypothetical protein